jgi:hypothetical protein
MSSSLPLQHRCPRRLAQPQPRRRPGRPRGIGIGIALALAVVAALAVPASAQRVTAQIQGRIVSKASPAAGAIVVATNLDTTAATTVVTDTRGGYLLAALPPGQYLLAVTLTSGEEAVETVVVGIGQSVQFNLDVSASAVSGSETIVVASSVTENKTSEVATNISREQLRSLPQNSRNFLNFALLAPGVRGSTDELNQSISSTASASRATSCRAAWSGRTPAAAIRSRSWPSAASAC